MEEEEEVQNLKIKCTCYVESTECLLAQAQLFTLNVSQIRFTASFIDPVLKKLQEAIHKPL